MKPNLLHRLAAMLLIPTLVSAQWTVTRGQQAASVHCPLSTDHSPFASQALMLRPIASIEKALDPDAAGLARRMADQRRAHPPSSEELMNDEAAHLKPPSRSTPLAIVRDSEPGELWDLLLDAWLTPEYKEKSEAQLVKEFRKVIAAEAPESIMQDYVDRLIEIVERACIEAAQGIDPGDITDDVYLVINQFLADHDVRGILRKNSQWTAATNKDMEGLHALIFWLDDLIGTEFMEASERLTDWRKGAVEDGPDDSEWIIRLFKEAGQRGREAAKKYLITYNRNRMPDLPERTAGDTFDRGPAIMPEAHEGRSSIDRDKQLQVLGEAFQIVQSRTGTLAQIRRMNPFEFARRLGAKGVQGNYKVFRTYRWIGVTRSAWKTIQQARAGEIPKERIAYFDDLIRFVDGPGIYYSLDDSDAKMREDKPGIFHILVELLAEKAGINMPDYQPWVGDQHPMVLEAEFRFAHLLGGHEIAGTALRARKTLAFLDKYLNVTKDYLRLRKIRMCMSLVSEKYGESQSPDYRDESLKLWKQAARQRGVNRASLLSIIPLLIAAIAGAAAYYSAPYILSMLALPGMPGTDLATLFVWTWLPHNPLVLALTMAASTFLALNIGAESPAATKRKLKRWAKQYLPPGNFNTLSPTTLPEGVKVQGELSDMGREPRLRAIRNGVLIDDQVSAKTLSGMLTDAMLMVERGCKQCPAIVIRGLRDGQEVLTTLHVLASPRAYREIRSGWDSYREGLSNIQMFIFTPMRVLPPRPALTTRDYHFHNLIFDLQSDPSISVLVLPLHALTKTEAEISKHEKFEDADFTTSLIATRQGVSLVTHGPGEPLKDVRYQQYLWQEFSGTSAPGPAHKASLGPSLTLQLSPHRRPVKLQSLLGQAA